MFLSLCLGWARLADLYYSPWGDQLRLRSLKMVGYAGGLTYLTSLWALQLQFVERNPTVRCLPMRHVNATDSFINDRRRHFYNYYIIEQTSKLYVPAFL